MGRCLSPAGRYPVRFYEAVAFRVSVRSSETRLAESRQSVAHEGQEPAQDGDVRHTGPQCSSSERILAPLPVTWYVYSAEWWLTWPVTAAVVVSFGISAELRSDPCGGIRRAMLALQHFLTEKR